nr:NDR1/HIN1-like protein 10 [Arachis hypogaea]
MCLRSFRCSFCCIFVTLYTLFLCFILSIFLFWIIISPSSVKFQVTNASLTQFNLTNNNTTLNYKFKVNIIARNPNNNVVVYYRRITAYAWYKDRPKQIAEYNMERSVGIFNDLAVDLDVTIRAKFGRIKSSRFDPQFVKCRRLRVPLILNAKPAATFNVRRCSSPYFFQDRDDEG